jgi:putative ABC transport system permease protein
MNYAVELGLRGLLRQPRTMALSIVTLGLGLAAVMTMLTLLSMLSADPLPGLSQHLYLGWVDSRETPKTGSAVADDNASPPSLWKLADVQAMAAAHPQVRQTALVTTDLTVASLDGHRSDRSQAVLSLGPMSSMFGVPLLHGRFWTAQEEQSRARVVVIDRNTSLELLGTGNGVGRELRVGKDVFRVIGISGRWAPQPRFHFLQEGSSAWGDDRDDNTFIPALAAIDAGVVPLNIRDCDVEKADGFHVDEVDIQACRWLVLWAELRTPEQVATFRDDLADYASDRHAAGIFPRSPRARLYSVRQWLSANRVVPDSVRLNLWLALGLLTLCMVNVAGLLAARFVHRSGELGVRRVLGAPRRSIVLQCLTEAGVAGLLGGLLALPLTLFGLWVIRLQAQDYTDMARFNPGMFLTLLTLATATGLLVGLLPAWRAARLEPALQVKSI